jgi:primosomal replication protein N
LVAGLIEREALRYTPAGVPMVGLRLSHSSTQREAGADRQVELEIAAVAADAVALRMSRVPLGASLQVCGFLAPRRRSARSLVLHVTEFELVASTETNPERL